MKLNYTIIVKLQCKLKFAKICSPCQISRLSRQKCGNTASKTFKISNFSHKFAPIMWLQWAVEHRPKCKLQTVNAKPKPNNYQSSAEVRPNVEASLSRSFRPMFGVNRTSLHLYYTVTMHCVSSICYALFWSCLKTSFLSENRLNECQIFDGSVFETKYEPIFGFLHTPSYNQA